MIVFYGPENHSSGLNEIEGGALSLTSPLSGDLGELFGHVEPITGVGLFQYRKLFIRNESYNRLTGVKVWFDSEEYSGRLTLGPEFVEDQTIGDTLSTPTGVLFSGYTNYTSGFSISDLLPYSATGFWLRQSYSGLSGQDSYATARIYVGWKP